MSLETPQNEKFDHVCEENKILEEVEPKMASIFNLMTRRPLAERPQ